VTIKVTVKFITVIKKNVTTLLLQLRKKNNAVTNPLQKKVTIMVTALRVITSQP